MQSLTSFSPYASPLREAIDGYAATLQGGQNAHVLGSETNEYGEARAACMTPSLMQDVTSGQCRSSQLDAGPVPAYSFADMLLPAQAFQQQMLSGRSNGNPQLAALFLAPKNVQRVLEQARGHLSHAMQKAVHIPVDGQVIETFVDLMANNSGAPPTPAYAQQMSETAFNRLLSERFYGLRQRSLFQRYFIDKDRIRTMPHPEYMAHQRGEVLIDTSGTQLGHPASRYQAQYLRDTMLPVKTQRLGTTLCEPRTGFF
jgi:hypothetical protein